MAQEVYVLWFNHDELTGRNDFHWCFWVKPSSSEEGTKSDVFSVDGGEWACSYLRNFKMSESSNVGGSVYLGLVSSHSQALWCLLRYPEKQRIARRGLLRENLVTFLFDHDRNPQGYSFRKQQYELEPCSLRLTIVIYESFTLSSPKRR